ncbi:MAG TPA: hypothetical protein VG167_18750 [Verrucomicrobiae bacterium]|nr:hypothetical protein [Verrucomicrobiae bacterium]
MNTMNSTDGNALPKAEASLQQNPTFQAEASKLRAAIGLPEKPRRPRPLTPQQILALMRPIWKLRDRMKAVGGVDPEMGEMAAELSKISQRLFKLHDDRELREAKRKDKGEVLWEVFHPRTTTPLHCSMFDLQQHTVRTPNTITKHNQFFTIKAETVLAAPAGAWRDLDKELHSKPFDLEEFRRYARDIDEALRRRDARRAMEKEAA